MRRSAVLAAIFVVGGLAGAAPAQAIAIYFGTPGNAAYCGFGPDSPHRASEEFINCFTPNDGFYVYMTRYAKPHKGYDATYKGMYVKPYRRLRFGQRWQSRGFQCTSRRSGLDCTNAAGHGWHLGRYVGYRIY